MRTESLREAWNRVAPGWVEFARDPKADVPYGCLNLPSFLDLLPRPGFLTVDVGCGEGRLGRVLQSRGHNVLGIDASPTMVRAAVGCTEPIPVLVGDASALPLATAVADLVVAFMVLQDVDDLEATVREMARILLPAGRLCLAVSHPFFICGDFTGEERQGPFEVHRPYFQEQPLVFTVRHGNAPIACHFRHRSVEAYARSLEAAGLLIEVLREPAPDERHQDLLPDWRQRRQVPSLLHIRALKTP